MRTKQEVKEVADVEEVEEKNGGVAAFFDLDGTLTSLPSLEKRFFLMLRYRKLIGSRNYFLWLVGALRLIPRGISRGIHTNKMYLRGVRVEAGGSGTGIPACRSVRDETGNQREVAKGKTRETIETSARRRQAGMSVPLLAEAIERVAWHAERGHLLVIVSGTLKFLAEQAARALEQELRSRELACTIRVFATPLEAENGRWTGRIGGEAMFGEAKARAVRRIAAEENLDLRRCFAYGDSTNDRWMLECVGKPAAVNPSNDLARIARRNDWAILYWGREKTFTQRMLRAQRTQRTDASEHELRMVRPKAGYRT